jgi:hypothetical protein
LNELQTGWGLTEHLVFDLRMVENFFEFFFSKKREGIWKEILVKLCTYHNN